jgi:hypothetical protein
VFPPAAKRVIEDLVIKRPEGITCKQIQREVLDKAECACSIHVISLYIKEELGMKFKKIYHLHPNTNKHGAILQRQVAAATYIRLLHEERVIASIDESSFDQTDFRKKGWGFINEKQYLTNELRPS